VAQLKSLPSMPVLPVVMFFSALVAQVPLRLDPWRLPLGVLLMAAVGLLLLLLVLAMLGLAPLSLLPVATTLWLLLTRVAP
jgi:hypothetical protein